MRSQLVNTLGFVDDVSLLEKSLLYGYNDAFLVLKRRIQYCMQMQRNEKATTINDLQQKRLQKPRIYIVTKSIHFPNNYITLEATNRHVISTEDPASFS